jgi:hypothetical protein
MLKISTMKIPQLVLLIDDMIVIFIITWIGINFHQTDIYVFNRMTYTFLPFFGAWIFFAFPLQLYDPVKASTWNQLWRIPVNAILAAPLAASIRAVWLGLPIVPVFVLVMGFTITIGVLISRILFILIMGKRISRVDNG